jgi:radical SAM protein with 4Fe4S-binding SPASM domain
MEQKPIDELSLEISYDCPHNCIMCSSSACHPSPLKNELSTPEINNLLLTSRKSSLNPKNFSISGGEPLQHPDIWKIMANARDLNYKILLYTTGMTIQEDGIHNMLPSEAQRLKDLNAKVIFDLQSPDEKTCDKIMGTKGYFENVIANIKLCKSVGLEIESHWVPMTINFHQFFDYIEMMNELEVDKFSVLRFVRQGRSNENRHLEISKKQFKELQFMFLRAEEEKVSNMRLGHPVDRRFQISPKYKVPVCRGATDAPLLHPTGEVVMCPSWKNLTAFSPGNVREKSLESIMNESKYYKIFYDFIHKEGWKNLVGKCQECNFLSRCRGGCPSQRLIHHVGKANIPLEEAIKIGADPMCFYMD